jgi:hypothetical protein
MAARDKRLGQIFRLGQASTQWVPLQEAGMADLIDLASFSELAALVVLRG